MSRTYNTPAANRRGTYGQSIPAIDPDDFIRYGERRRILFATENADLRTNVGCQNGGSGGVVVRIELFDSDGTSLGHRDFWSAGVVERPAQPDLRRLPAGGGLRATCGRRCRAGASTATALCLRQRDVRIRPRSCRSSGASKERRRAGGNSRPFCLRSIQHCHRFRNPCTWYGVSDTPGLAGGVALGGGCACVADHSGGLRVIDVSIPAVPVEVGSVDTPDFIGGVAGSGGHVYVTDRSHGLRTIDVSSPAYPIEVGSVDTPGVAEGIAVVGSLAYVADGSAGLRVIDISTPENPLEVGSADTPGYAEGVAVDGGHAYVTDGGAGLRVFDISAPASPTEVGFVDTPGLPAVWPCLGVTPTSRMTTEDCGSSTSPPRRIPSRSAPSWSTDQSMTSRSQATMLTSPPWNLSSLT